MKRKYLLLTIILFMCLFLFSTPSLALIPGDFGSAGGGPPDGCVDFEDLMIFAMAYGSTPPDTNWNLFCDIYPDGIIDFEDLMIFAMHYGESSVHNLTKDTYYNTIQAALDDADSGNTIEVSPETYYENIDFNGKNITLRSINPDDPEVVASTVINGGKNGSVVTFSSGEGNGAVLQGFTITNGSGTEEEPDWICGGGIYVFNSSPTIIGNIISKNSVDLVGGGIYMRYSSSNITGNTIIENSAVRCDGGGISMLNSSPTISGNAISGNTAEDVGGGIAIWHSSPTISGNTITENSAVASGGGICVSSNSYVRTTDGNDWPRNNKPPNEEDTNTYSGNTHGDPPGYTEGADVYFECILPSAPTLYNPGTSVVSGTTYTVSWSVVSGATSYVLQEATSSDFTNGLQEYPVTDTNKSFCHTVSTTTYYYRVAAVNDCGQSDWSNVEDIDVAPQTQEPITPGGMAYVWYDWPQLPVSGFYNFDILLTINVDPGVQSAYYWAHQFHFKNGDGGYMGLQTNGWMQGEWIGKMVIFSTWEALEAEPGPGASCECFTGEGVGWSCRIPYEWVEGRTYRLRIWALGVDEQENEWWGAWIIDTSFNQETYIGKIKVPSSWQWLDDYSVVWVEYYGQVNDCDSIPYAKVRFEQPVADNGSFVPQNLTPIIGTTCTNAQITLLENQGVIFETGGLTLY